MGVSQLGYLHFDVVDLEGWRTIMSDVVGAELRPDAPADTLLYRLDDHHHRLKLRKAAADKLVAVGWEAPSMAEFQRLRNAVEAAGCATADGTRDELQDRRVVALFRFAGPDDVPLEIYFSRWTEDVPMRPSRAASGFNCGAQGLGHLLLACKDKEKAVDFYREVLGFGLSDFIVWDEADATFLHCNPRHHSLALLNECYGMTGGQVQHFMLEANSLDDVGRAYDMVLERKIPLFLTLGRHSNDFMTSFYMFTPSGFAIEYGHGGRRVDVPDWQVKHYSTPKLWGHNMPEAG